MKKPLAIHSTEAPLRTQTSNYPEPFAAKVSGRDKRVLGNQFGLTNFGINHTTLKPGAQSALMHQHSKQDEFIYILSGKPTLKTDEGDMKMSPGMCAGIPAAGLAHHLVNETDKEVVYLEIGDRSKGDTGTYPNDDLAAEMTNEGTWRFTQKDGTPY